MSQEIKNTSSNFSIIGHYVKDLSFENPHAPNSLMQADPPPHIDFSFDVKVNQLEEKVFEVITLTNATATRGEDSIFILELEYSGLFTLENLEEKEFEQVLLVHGPQFLFPYIRRIVSDTTRDGGFIPLMLQPMDFMSLYMQKKESEQSNSTNVN